MWIDLPPFLPFFLGALLVAVAPRGWARSAVLLGIPILGGLNLIGADSGPHLQVEVFHYTLTPFAVGTFSLLFGYIFHIAAFIGNLFALHLKRDDDDTLQHAAALLYAGSALGAVFAGDFITLFVFWELLAVTSVFLIWANRTDRSVRVGFRYLIIQVLSGLLLLTGALIRVHETGSIAFEYVGLEGLGAWLIFLSFGLNPSILGGSFPSETAASMSMRTSYILALT